MQPSATAPWAIEVVVEVEVVVEEVNKRGGLG
jgi:hypothetical protein